MATSTRSADIATVRREIVAAGRALSWSCSWSLHFAAMWGVEDSWGARADASRISASSYLWQPFMRAERASRRPKSPGRRGSRSGRSTSELVAARALVSVLGRASLGGKVFLFQARC